MERGALNSLALAAAAEALGMSERQFDCWSPWALQQLLAQADAEGAPLVERLKLIVKTAANRLGAINPSASRSSVGHRQLVSDLVDFVIAAGVEVAPAIFARRILSAARRIKYGSKNYDLRMKEHNFRPMFASTWTVVAALASGLARSIRQGVPLEDRDELFEPIELLAAAIQPEDLETGRAHVRKLMRIST